MGPVPPVSTWGQVPGMGTGTPHSHLTHPEPSAAGDNTCFQCARKSTAPMSCVTKTRLTRTKNWKAAGQKGQKSSSAHVQLAPAAPPLLCHHPCSCTGTGGQEMSMWCMGTDTASLSSAAVRQNMTGAGEGKDIFISKIYQRCQRYI